MTDVRPLRVDLLGPVRARVGDDEFALGPARQRAVFAVLAARPGETVSRRELIAAVWGDTAPQSADGSVYTYISGLRRALAADSERLLTSDSAGYRLRLSADALDVARFDRLRAEGERAAAGGDHAGAADSFDAALRLWHGEPYSGVPGPFAEAERIRLRELWIATAERRAAMLLALGRHTDLAPELAVLVRDHPLRETLRAHLMLALHRGGRPADALAVYQDARRVLLAELSVEPGPELRALHERVLAGDPALDLPSPPPPLPDGPGLPPRVDRALADPGGLVGRDAELALLCDRLDDLLAGTGSSVWVEAAAGMGKSELLAAALADARERGCLLAWAAADEMVRRFPLQVVLECLGVDADPRGPALGDAWADADPVLLAVDRLLGHVDDLCARAPLVIVIEDMQWADDASLLVWHRLATATVQLPLLLVGAARPAAHHADLAQLVRGIEARGHVLRLDRLDRASCLDLLARRFDARPGPGLAELVARADGNPLYLAEMADALARSGAVEIADGVADIDDPSAHQAPTSLVAAMERTLDGLRDITREVLRHAVLLGSEFTIADLAAVTDRPPSALVDVVDEAVAASVLVDTGTQLGIRHPLLRQVLHDGMPGAVRAALRRQAAEALADSGAGVRRVAEQLIAVPTAPDAWVARWLADHAAELAASAPLIAVDLLRRVLDTRHPAPATREHLTVTLVRVLFRLARNPETEARQAIALTTDAATAAEMRQLLAAMLHRRGQTEWAREVIAESLPDPAVPDVWRSRHLALLASFQRGDLTAADADAAQSSGMAALVAAAASEDACSLARAYQTLWQVASVRRDHETALRHVDAGLTAVHDRRDLADVHFDLLDNRMFTLQNLDRLAEARATLKSARELTARHALPSGLQVSAAVHFYWEGRWDEALAELDTVIEDGPEITFYGLREPGPAALLLHGVAALIAGRRGDRDTAAAHLDAAAVHKPATRPERESVDFLLAAQALAAEQAGDAARALAIMAPILNPAYARMMLRHQWLPDIARLAAALGDADGARTVLAAAADEARRETVPARAFAALHWCRAVIESDVDAGRQAAEHFGRVGRFVELAGVFEDLGVVHARSGDSADARKMLTEATWLYGELGARWDDQRARARLDALGIPAAHQRRNRPRTGWESLSPVEIRIAVLVSQGRSNPEIARELPLPRRTVQAHITRILRKLGVDSRAGVTAQVREHLPKAGPLSQTLLAIR